MSIKNTQVKRKIFGKTASLPEGLSLMIFRLISTRPESKRTFGAFEHNEGRYI